MLLKKKKITYIISTTKNKYICKNNINMKESEEEDIKLIEYEKKNL